MSSRPRPIDEVFDGTFVPETIATRLANLPHFKNAVRDAEEAYHRTKADNERLEREGRGTPGTPTPSQSASTAFLTFLASYPGDAESRV